MKTKTAALVFVMAVAAMGCREKPKGQLWNLNTVVETALDQGWRYATYVRHTADPSCSYLALPGHGVFTVVIQGINPEYEPMQAEMCCLASHFDYGENNYWVEYCAFKE